jgi:hypothetical protein
MRNVDGSDHRGTDEVSTDTTCAKTGCSGHARCKVVEDRERAHGHESDSDGLVDVKLVVRDSERSECNDETLWASS